MTLTPNMSDILLDTIYNSNHLFEGVIIEAFGQGNLPNNTLLKEYLMDKDKHAITFIISQCHKGNVAGTYSSSAGFIGAILCADMTLPAVFCKASLILAKTKDKKQVENHFLGSMQGEVSEKPYQFKGRQGGAIQFYESKFNPYIKTEEEMNSLIEGITPTLLNAAAKYNNIMVIDELIRFNPECSRARLYDDSNIFHSAVFQYSQKALDFIVSYITSTSLQELVNEKDTYGWTPLHYAIKTKLPEAIDGLKKCGAVYPSEDHLEVVADLLE